MGVGGREEGRGGGILVCINIKNGHKNHLESALMIYMKLLGFSTSQI